MARRMSEVNCVQVMPRWREEKLHPPLTAIDDLPPNLVQLLVLLCYYTAR